MFKAFDRSILMDGDLHQIGVAVSRIDEVALVSQSLSLLDEIKVVGFWGAKKKTFPTNICMDGGHKLCNDGAAACH
jgi:hypothetical protein